MPAMIRLPRPLPAPASSLTLRRGRALAWACTAILALATLPLPAGARQPEASPDPATQDASSPAQEYRLAAGDVIHIAVFQNPDLTLEARLAENGTISYPLIGSVALAGAGVTEAERKIEKALKDGGYVVAPQVTITIVQVRGNQVTVLGQVGKPGRYPLDSAGVRLADILALAGGIAPTGSDTVVLSGTRDGKPMREELDVQNLADPQSPANQTQLRAGDMILVNRAPNFYIYGEVQKPGVYRLERGLTVMQALATGGGLTAKGTQRGLRVHRHGSDGKVQVIEPKLDDLLLPDDVLYVRESIF